MKIQPAAVWAALVLAVQLSFAEPQSGLAKGSSRVGQIGLIDSNGIEDAKPKPGDTAPARKLIARIQVLLDRAHFSPGEIDGRNGDNVKRAMRSYKQAHNIPNPEKFDDAVLQALTANDHAPALQSYTIPADDEKAQFLGTVPKDFEALAKLKRVGYANPEEALAEKFHMSPALLRELNPKADFDKTGTSITVVRLGTEALNETARLEVDKSANQLRAYNNAGTMIAAYPATVGSTERPAPSGTATVVAVAENPDYTYDPRRETFGPKSAGVLKIAPGPNNPVGSTWISLSIETYGIHGAPEPELVGKTASHGCVRLTNWDAAELAKAVKKGMPVEFVGQTKSKPT